MERDNEYLEDRLDYLISKYFSEIEISNQLLIKFGKRSRRQLGCIKRKARRGFFDFLKSDNNNPSIITITGYFRDTSIPEGIIDSTIAHELVHYVHGFNSPLPRLYNHPHRGNIVHKELKKRGLEDLYIESERWLKENWRNYVMKSFG